MSAIEILAALFVQLLWGVQFVTSKVGLDSIPPLLFVTLRFAIVAAVLLPFAGMPTRRELRAAAAVSVFFGSLCFGLFFVGLKLGDASLSAVLAQLMTPFTVVFGWMLMGERPAVRTVLGTLIAFAGVALALWQPGRNATLVGAALVIAAAAAQGFGNVLVKRLGPVPPLRLVAWLAVFATPQLALASACLERGQATALRTAPPLAWASLFYTSLLGAVVAFGLWFWLIGRVPLGRIAPYALLQTAFGLAASVVVLGERVTLPLLAGAVVCLSGVFITQLPASRARTATAIRPYGSSTS